MRNLSLGLTLALTVLVSGIVQAQGKTDPALNKITAAFEAAFNAKDAAKVASLYTEDAVAMPPDSPIVSGRSAIEARLKKDMQQEPVTLKLNPTASAISGDHAHEVGTATVTLPDGRKLEEKYLVVYKRVGGEWKIAYDIWNSNAPQPPKK